MDAWEILINNATNTTDAWYALNSQIQGSGGEANTYIAKHGVTFNISPSELLFSIANSKLEFSIKPLVYSFRIATYVNGVPV